MFGRVMLAFAFGALFGVGGAGAMMSPLGLLLPMSIATGLNVSLETALWFCSIGFGGFWFLFIMALTSPR